MYDFILITVPHAKKGGLPLSFHSYDKTAEIHAFKLLSALRKRNIKSNILLGNYNRDYMDLNRKESKETGFHKTINNLFIKYQKKNLLVLDIHSGDDNELFGDNPFVILDYINSNLDDQIIDRLNKQFKITLKHQGTTDNYILNKTFKAGFNGILIEFNEKLKTPYESSFYNKIIDCILF